MSAGDLVFVDSSVLVYTFDSVDPAKRNAAVHWLARLWETRAGRLSWQVLHESYVNATVKLGAPAGLVRASIESLASWNVTGFHLPLLHRAWHWADTSQVHFWDGLILASAESAGCRWLLSEDFQHDREYGSLRIVSPFKISPEELLPAN